MTYKDREGRPTNLDQEEVDGEAVGLLPGVPREETLAVNNLLALADFTSEKVHAELAPEDSPLVREQFELSTEEAEMLRILEIQYQQMVAALQRYKIPVNGMPRWDTLRRRLTKEVLKNVSKLREPALLLIPPTTRRVKVQAIDKHPVDGQKYDTCTYDLENNDLWDSGKSETESRWRVAIVEGTQEVDVDPEIVKDGATNYEMAVTWAKKIQDQGLDVLEGADAYLTLMMKGLAEGKPIDPNTFTVLNAKSLTKSSLVADGDWYSAQVRLRYDSPDDSYSFLRLRASVGIDVP